MWPLVSIQARFVHHSPNASAMTARDHRGRAELAECKLCGQSRPLCRSHIIPEWAYRPLYDRQSRATAISSEDRRRRTVQQGLWERLFCVDCEQFFNRFDYPFHTFWAAPKRFPAVLNEPFVKISGIDYEITSSFLLSVLWRAHVANHKALSGVTLGPHADRIREILQNPDAAAAFPRSRYPIFGYVLYDPECGGIANRIVLTPARTRTDGQWNYLVAFLGCLWKIFVSTEQPLLPASCALSGTGTIVMPVVSYKTLPILRGVVSTNNVS